MDQRVKIQEIIVVEGLHDRQRVEQVVDGDIWVMGGDRIAHKLIQELKRAAQSRGIIVLTDPDGPGERIRRRIADAVPNCKHAFIPREQARNASRLGVEHAAPEAVRKAILQARPTQSADDTPPTFTLDDLVRTGLIHHAEAATRRLQLGEALGIGYANAKSFLRKLNALCVTREEFEAAVSKVLCHENTEQG